MKLRHNPRLLPDPEPIEREKEPVEMILTNAKFLADGLTVCFSLKVTEPGNSEVLAFKGDDERPYDICIVVTRDYAVQFTVNIHDMATQRVITENNLLQRNEWATLIFRTATDGHLQFQLNGEPIKLTFVSEDSTHPDSVAIPHHANPMLTGTPTWTDMAPLQVVDFQMHSPRAWGRELSNHEHRIIFEQERRTFGVGVNDSDGTFQATPVTLAETWDDAPLTMLVTPNRIINEDWTTVGTAPNLGTIVELVIIIVADFADDRMVQVQAYHSEPDTPGEVLAVSGLLSIGSGSMMNLPCNIPPGLLEIRARSMQGEAIEAQFNIMGRMMKGHVDMARADKSAPIIYYCTHYGCFS